ncbi:uncharacterized protein B0H18DRAFT_1124437 [Fomitopsis serialis]|uniref:uncharacterized protein n=1 Tax=Fomitopsis serialis TaxID=139415 RepID=UPI002008662C|nr:uncharacterized protein B0H18DRAFT_1124437 [Neoantrodia serialis]KAH9916143.1 hypothetical protein B0H18DRAFT_1124437 [Neoantrodia serialis]
MPRNTAPIITQPDLDMYLARVNGHLLTLMGGGLVEKKEKELLSAKQREKFEKLIDPAVYQVFGAWSQDMSPEARPKAPRLLLSAMLELSYSTKEAPVLFSNIRPDDPRVAKCRWLNPLAPSGLPPPVPTKAPEPGPSREPQTVRFQHLAADEEDDEGMDGVVDSGQMDVGEDGEEEMPVEEDMEEVVVDKKGKGKAVPAASRRLGSKAAVVDEEVDEEDAEQSELEDEEVGQQEARRPAKKAKPSKGILKATAEEMNEERAKFKIDYSKEKTRRLEYVRPMPYTCIWCRGFPCQISAPRGSEFKVDGTLRKLPPACDFCHVKKIKCEPIDTDGTFQPARGPRRRSSSRASSVASDAEVSDAEAPPTTADGSDDDSDAGSVATTASRRTTRRSATPSRLPTTVTAKPPSKVSTGPKAAPARKALAKKAPAKKAQAEEVQAEKAPAKEVPVKKAPAKTAPAKTAPAKAAPAKTAPSKTAPSKTAPSKTAPAETAPAETAPAETAPQNAEAGPSTVAAPKRRRANKAQGPELDPADIKRVYPVMPNSKVRPALGLPISVVHAEDMRPDIMALRIQELQDQVGSMSERIVALEVANRALREDQRLISRAWLAGDGNPTYVTVIREMVNRMQMNMGWEDTGSYSEGGSPPVRWSPLADEEGVEEEMMDRMSVTPSPDRPWPRRSPSPRPQPEKSRPLEDDASQPAPNVERPSEVTTRVSPPSTSVDHPPPVPQPTGLPPSAITTASARPANLTPIGRTISQVPVPTSSTLRTRGRTPPAEASMSDLRLAFQRAWIPPDLFKNLPLRQAQSSSTLPIAAVNPGASSTAAQLEQAKAVEGGALTDAEPTVKAAGTVHGEETVRAAAPEGSGTAVSAVSDTGPEAKLGVDASTEHASAVVCPPATQATFTAEPEATAEPSPTTTAALTGEVPTTTAALTGEVPTTTAALTGGGALTTAALTAEVALTTAVPASAPGDAPITEAHSTTSEGVSSVGAAPRSEAVPTANGPPMPAPAGNAPQMDGEQIGGTADDEERPETGEPTTAAMDTTE